MKNRPSHIVFESMAADLFDKLPKVRNAASLLSIATDILEAEIGVLVRHPGGGAHPAEVVGVRPQNRHPWAASHLDALRWWAGKKPPAHHKGFTHERELEVGGQRFRDSLVAFGHPGPRGRPPQYELILLQRQDARYAYSTYHAAIAAALLRHYEQLQTLRHTESARRQYADLLSLDVLLECDWEEFLRKVGKEDGHKLQQQEFMGPAAILATAYALWGRTKGIARDAARTPLQWLAHQSRPEKWAAAVKLVDFLKHPRPLDQEMADLALQYSRIDESGLKAALVLLEQGWRVVHQTAVSPPAGTRGHLPEPEQCQALLALTSALCASELGKHPPREAGSVPIGRDALRLYFAVLLCGAQRLRERYLWIDSSPENTCRQVPRELRREFLLNLSRYMLGVTATLERLNRVVSAPQAVTRVEVLDGLLYAVDRFAHVELEVDERLNIREHLGRGYRFEVNRHLTQRFYRDHLIHVIDVFLLGVLLLRTRLTWPGGEEKPLLEHIAWLCAEDPAGRTRQHRLPGQWLRDWATASLFHDLGYQVGLYGDAFQDVKNGRQYFALPRPPALEWLEIGQLGGASLPDGLRRMLDGFQEGDGQCRWLPAGEADLKDHGVLSAIRVAQLLAHAECEDRSQGDADGLPLVNDYANALHAMAHHNLFSCVVRFATHPLSCLLRLCDELQEWGRRRVNIEHFVKQLYLQIEDDCEANMAGHESLDHLSANLVFIPQESAEPVEVDTRVGDGGSDLRFHLVYHNPVAARYDAITTLLSKAYNFQHVDLSTPNSGATGVRWRLLLEFPRPEEYRGLSERDIYGLLRERIRVLPDIWRHPLTDRLPAGLAWIDTGAGEPPMDCLAITLRDGVNHRNQGWQTCNPDLLRDRLIDLKRQLLTLHTMGPDGRWLIRPE